MASTHLSGRIVPQSGGGLDKIGTLFSKYLSGENITLQTTGESVQPSGPSGTIDWLTAAFKTLTLDIILPGQKLQVGRFDYYDERAHSPLGHQRDSLR